MYLKTLTIHNFQCHEDTSIDLSCFTNSIFGQTNSGKSSIIRALECLLFKGPFYLRHGCVEGYVEGTMSDGNVVRRSRKVRGAVISDLYVLNGVRYSKFGREVPEDIQRALGLHLIDFGDGLELNLNFQPQHDSKFLLSRDYDGMTRTKVTSIFGIKAIEKCMIQSSKTVRALGSEITGEEKACSDFKTRISWFADMDTQVSRVENMKMQYNNLLDKSKRLEWLKANRQKILDFNNLKPKTWPIQETIDGLAKLGQLSLAKRLLSVLTDQHDIICPPSDEVLKALLSKRKIALRLTMILAKIEDSDWMMNDTKRKIEVITTEIAATNICPTCSRTL